MQGRDVIIVSTQDFDDLWTRKQRWASRLARTNRVLYVESQMHWLTLLRTWPRHRARLRARRRALRRVQRNLWVWTPPVIWPFFQMWRPINRLNNRRLSRHLQELTAALGLRDPLLWLYTPYSTDLIDTLRPANTVYESVDDFSAAQGLIRASVVRRMEDTTFQRADLTLVTTPHLGELAARRTTRWRLSPNACEVGFFARAGDSSTPVHPALRDRPRPIFGFIGAVAYWVDCELLAHLARARPDATVVVVGPVRVDITPFAHIRNLIFLGEVPYASLPEILRGFDVCLNPYKTDNIARGASPLKLYEYLATGKPVVSTPMPEAERFADVVRIAETHNDFVAACNAACEETPEEAAQRRRLQYVLVAPHTWDERFSEIEKWIDELVPAAASALSATAEPPQPWTFTRAPERAPGAEARSRHVVVNALSVGGPELAGGFTFLTNILRSMIAQHPDVHFSVIVTRRAARYFAWGFDNLKLVVHPNMLNCGPMRAVYERYLMPRLLQRRGADAYYLPYGFLPSRRVCPQVMVFQNLYFLHADEYAHWSAPHWWARLYERARLHVYRRRLQSDCLAADRILAVSETARQDLIAHLSLPNDRIAVVREGVGLPFIPAADTVTDSVTRVTLGVRGAYFLSVGAIAPNKNLPRLLAAYAQYVASDPTGPDLVLAGPVWGGFAERIAAEACARGIEHRVRFLGFVAPESLAALYRGATATIQLSTCESFGLPAVEAMACGSPLIVANTSGLAEVGGDGAIQVDPADSKQVARMLMRLRTDKPWRSEWIAKGESRARAFSWETAAERTFALIARTAGWEDDEALPRVIHRVTPTLTRRHQPEEVEA